MKTHSPHPNKPGHAKCGALLHLVSIAEGAPPTCRVCAASPARPRLTHTAHPKGNGRAWCGAPCGEDSGGAPTCPVCAERAEARATRAVAVKVPTWAEVTRRRLAKEQG